jgi:structural maintenance of chromosome 4
MVRATRKSTAGTRRSASAVPVSSPVQSSPKRRRKTINPSPPPESDDEASDTSIMTSVTTKSSSTVTSTLSSRAPRRATRGRASSTRQSTRRTTRNTLSAADIQEENMTMDSSLSKLTPAPSESARSVTPPIIPPEPATPIKKEPQQDSPKSTSDKENQVPLLAVPSLLGSVKKGQQLTPPPEYVSPRKLDIARLTAMQAIDVPEGPRNRIVITHLVLHNFKSYAGRQLIGPFHTVFLL